MNQGNQPAIPMLDKIELALDRPLHGTAHHNYLQTIAMRTLASIMDMERASNQREMFEYTPEKLIQHAWKYFEESPPNLVQYCEKMWFAAAWSMKRYFLRHHILLSSHDVYRIYKNFLLNMNLGDPSRLAVSDGWLKAEWFHEFACGEPRFRYQSRQSFREWGEEVGKVGRAFADGADRSEHKPDHRKGSPPESRKDMDRVANRAAGRNDPFLY